MRASVLPMAVEFPEGASQSSHKEKRIVFAGRFDSVKNPLLFLKGVQTYQKMFKDMPARFLMIGSGALEPEIRAFLQEHPLENFSLEAAYPRDKMPELYQNAYTLVLTSQMEGFPLNVLEASRYGVPAIGCRTTGLDEVIQDGKTGLLFAPESQEELAQRINQLIRAPELRDNLGENARDFSRRFTCQNMADVFLRAVEK